MNHFGLFATNTSEIILKHFVFITLIVDSHDSGAALRHGGTDQCGVVLKKMLSNKKKMHCFHFSLLFLLLLSLINGIIITFFYYYFQCSRKKK